MMNKGGFTLIELIMVIAILGILAVVAIPRYIDLANEARIAAEAGVIGAVRGGIHTSFAENLVWPATLEAAPDAAATVFEGVLEQGVEVNETTDGWALTDATGNPILYTGTTATVYEYYTATIGDNRAGSFVEQ